MGPRTAPSGLGRSPSPRGRAAGGGRGAPRGATAGGGRGTATKIRRKFDENSTENFFHTENPTKNSTSTKTKIRRKFDENSTKIRRKFDENSRGDTLGGHPPGQFFRAPKRVFRAPKRGVAPGFFAPRSGFFALRSGFLPPPSTVFPAAGPEGAGGTGSRQSSLHAAPHLVFTRSINYTRAALRPETKGLSNNSEKIHQGYSAEWGDAIRSVSSRL